VATGDARAPTLADLQDALGALVEVVVAPRGLDVPVGEPLIHDPSGGPGATAHDVVLMVGVDAGSATAVDLLDRLGRLGAVAAVIKLDRPAPERIVEAARERGLALLAVPAGTNWGQLLSLIRTALAARAQTSRSGSAEGLSVGDLFGLANAIAATVGGATTIEDLQSNVLAFSSLGHPIDQIRQDTILGRRVPPSWSRVISDQGIFRKLYRTRDVVRIDRLVSPAGGPDADAGRPRLAIAMRAGDEPLGSIWVIEGDRPLTAEAEESLRTAAQIAAMHVLHYRSAVDLERGRRAEQLRTVLTGDRPASIESRLRLPDGVPLAVLAFASDLHDADLVDQAVDALEAVLTLHIEVFHRTAHVVSIGELVYILLAAAETRDRARICELAGDLREHAERRVNRPVFVGIGSAVSGLDDLRRSRSEAEHALTVVRQRGEQLGHVEQLRGAIALHRLQSLARTDPELRLGKAAVLAAHDASNGTSYVATLRAYLDHFGDVPAAAEALFVHRNTFRYRLTRLLDLTGLDLNDPDERLITHLQLRLLDERTSGSIVGAQPHGGT
jgi:PucR C-terminal helix-turn-helix domain/GGDEF-like domain